MSETSQFFIDVINSMPVNSDCYFQAPHQEFKDAIKGISYETDDNVFVKFKLREEYLKILADVSANDIHELVQEAKIIWNDKKIFEAYDGFEIGTISKHFDINGTALANYLNQDILFISSQW